MLILIESKPNACCKCSFRSYQTLTHDFMLVISDSSLSQ